MARTYVVTGSASGIGQATRDRLEAQGHRVVGVDRHDAEVVADLATPDGRVALVDEVAEHTDGAVDAVVACAGVSEPGPLTVRVNYFGAVATLDGLRPLLARGTDPHAVVIASCASILPCDERLLDACLVGDEAEAAALADAAGLLVYPTSKRALARWVRRQAPTAAWAGAGIPLNAVAPGVILTPMTIGQFDTPEAREMLAEVMPMPLGGYGSPGEVAALLDWLAGTDNSMLCGQVVFIDGGADAVLRGDEVW